MLAHFGLRREGVHSARDKMKVRGTINTHLGGFGYVQSALHWGADAILVQLFRAEVWLEANRFSRDRTSAVSRA
jgi:hypothetical protein